MDEKELNELLIENRKMRKALEFIAKWKLPMAESRGEMVPFCVAYGSNGERDYMRGVASKALSMEKDDD